MREHESLDSRRDASKPGSGHEEPAAGWTRAANEDPEVSVDRRERVSGRRTVFSAELRSRVGGDRAVIDAPSREELERLLDAAIPGFKAAVRLRSGQQR